MIQRDNMKIEVNNFLAKAEDDMLEYELKDVYVTDHKPIAKRFSTLNEDEDNEYYNYVRSVEEYNKKPSMRSTRISQFNSGRYEQGSLQQRIFEPLAGAHTLENGTVFYEV